MKGLFIFSNKMEDIEGLGTNALLKRNGLDMTTAVKGESRKITTSYGQVVTVDLLFEEINVMDYDFLVIPGGPYVKETVDQDQKIKGLVKAFNKEDKLIAAICAGPRFLGQVGLLDNKKFTAFTGSEIDALKGHYSKEEKAVTDGNIITARGAGAVYEFVYEIVKYLKDEKTAQKLLDQILY